MEPCSIVRLNDQHQCRFQHKNNNIGREPNELLIGYKYLGSGLDRGNILLCPAPDQSIGEAMSIYVAVVTKGKHGMVLCLQGYYVRGVLIGHSGLGVRTGLLWRCP